MMADYKDMDGNTVSLLKLCSLEPEWARSRIETLTTEGGLKDAVVEAARPVAENVTPENWCELKRVIAALDQTECEHEPLTYTKHPSGDIVTKCRKCKEILDHAFTGL